jgi:hypothetical protein
VGQDRPLLGREVDVDHVGHGFGQVLQNPLGHLGELGVVADRRPEQQPEGRLVARDEPEVGRQAVLDPLPSAVGRSGGGGDLGQQAPPDVFQQLFVERSLRGKVLVEDGFRHSGSFGDIVHRRCVEPTGGEELARHVKKLVPPTRSWKTHGELRVTEASFPRSGHHPQKRTPLLRRPICPPAQESGERSQNLCCMNNGRWIRKPGFHRPPEPARPAPAQRASLCSLVARRRQRSRKGPTFLA